MRETTLDGANGPRVGGPGTLYLTATPIGNLADMTPRALAVLDGADLIAAEDTRRTLQLLNHFGLKGTLVRYDENNKDKEGPVLLEKLLAGQTIALVTDAGFPGISDPGEALARLAIDAGVPVVPVPGANACLTALVASGLPATPFFSGASCRRRKRTAPPNWRRGNTCRPRSSCTRRRTASRRSWRNSSPSGATGPWPSAAS